MVGLLARDNSQTVIFDPEWYLKNGRAGFSG